MVLDSVVHAIIEKVVIVVFTIVDSDVLVVIIEVTTGGDICLFVGIYV